MGVKESFIDKIAKDGMDESWLSRVVPEIADLPTPGTVEESTLAIATYCDNCNKILQMYEGIPLLEYGLRAGQMSAAAQALVLSSIERNPKSDGITAGTYWHWFLKVAGISGYSPTSEQFRAVGGDYHGDDTSDIYDALGSWLGDVKVWLGGLADQISAAEEAYIAGEEYALEFDAGTFPVITLPSPVDSDNPSLVWQGVKWLALISGNVWFPIVVEIARYLLRRASQGEQLSPLLKLLRKALLVKEGDVDQGLPDYTAILLMMVERAIHIVMSHNGVNAFIEPVWFDED